MAVIDNRLTEIGDVIVIKTDVPAIGIAALLSFTDVTQNETGSRFFIKQFRYSLDGINFSDYLPLSTANLQAIDINAKDLFIIEFLYERGGTDSSGELVLDSVDINSTFSNVITTEKFDNSIFSKFFVNYNVESLNWAINVLEKIYKKGILSNYIERGKNEDTREDQDFIDLWFSVTLYCSYFVSLARIFKDFFNNKELLKEYLEERNLYVWHDNQIDELIFLMKNYFQEIAHRGTEQIFRKKGETLFEDEDQYSISTSASYSASTSTSVSTSSSIDYSNKFIYRQVDGELLRLICYDECDEFLFGLGRPEKVGWNVGNSSPLFKGLSDQYQFSKGYEITEDIISKNSYPLKNKPLVQLVTNLNKASLKFTADNNSPNTEKVGIGNPLALNKRLVVNPYLSYQLTFYVRIPSGLDVLDAGFFTYDRYDNNISPISIITSTNTNYALQNGQLPKTDKFYFIRLILFGANQWNVYLSTELYNPKDIIVYSGNYYESILHDNSNNQPDISPTYWRLLTTTDIDYLTKTNILSGENLKMQSNVCKIMPIIYCNTTAPVPKNSTMYVWNVKLLPLHFDYSYYFVNVKNFVHTWIKQNNASYTNEQIENIMRRYLLPYNTYFKNNYLI